MQDDSQRVEELEHELANAEQSVRALKGMLGRGARELDHLADENCSDTAKSSAHLAAIKMRRAAAT